MSRFLTDATSPVTFAVILMCARQLYYVRVFAVAASTTTDGFSVYFIRLNIRLEWSCCFDQPTLQVIART